MEQKESRFGNIRIGNLGLRQYQCEIGIDIKIMAPLCFGYHRPSWATPDKVGPLWIKMGYSGLSQDIGDGVGLLQMESSQRRLNWAIADSQAIADGVRPWKTKLGCYRPSLAIIDRVGPS